MLVCLLRPTPHSPKAGPFVLLQLLCMLLVRRCPQLGSCSMSAEGPSTCSQCRYEQTGCFLHLEAQPQVCKSRLDSPEPQQGAPGRPEGHVLSRPLPGVAALHTAWGQGTLTPSKLLPSWSQERVTCLQGPRSRACWSSWPLAPALHLTTRPAVPALLPARPS